MGFKHDAEFCKSASDRVSGDKNPMYGQGHKVAGENNGRYGGAGTTEETRKKISKANKGKIHTEETKAIWSKQRSGDGNGMYGKSAYDIWVDKYGIEKANEMKAEVTKKLSAAGKGKPKSEETKEKMRNAATARELRKKESSSMHFGC